MGIHNPIGGGAKDPYDEYRKQVEAIDRENREKEKKEPPSKESLLPLAQFLLWVHKIIDYFLKTSTPSPNTSSNLKENLSQIRNAFETLKKEDRSEDVEFSNNLSRLWNHAVEHSLRRKKGEIFSTSLRSFVKEVQTYPEGEEHTLGYYLIEHAGQIGSLFPI